MSSPDKIERFLISDFEKNKHTIADEGFTEKVISNLPDKRIFLINRNFILYALSAISVLIFLISNGYKAVFLSVIDIFQSGFYRNKPSPVSFFVILVFISVSFIISRIEHNEDLC
jgi:hypothetical protein